MKLIVDPEFHALIPPLTTEERAQLEANVIADGCRDPLVIWNSILLDGHNRYDICTKRGIKFQTAEHPCKDRDDAAIWIIHNQFGRRNLKPFQRAELALKLEPLVAAKAKANQTGFKGNQYSGPLTKLTKDQSPINTRAEIAKAAGVSEGTIDKARVIAKRAPEEVKEQLRKGVVSIDRAYRDLRQETAPKEPAAETPRDPLETGRRVRNVSDQEATDAAALYDLKRLWKKASRKVRREFRSWIHEDNH
ncbi:MAG: hypothetical protein PHU85_20295 [Phycisphaerae bacterium]|nr:hypothetical protein [Phycisphaerae bacterium]